MPTPSTTPGSQATSPAHQNKEQLKIGGRLVIPVGERRQYLEVHTRTATGFEKRRVTAVRFVPMTGAVQEKKAVPFPNAQERSERR